MKKITLLMLLFSVYLIQAQGIKANNPNMFFGVDFSLAKVYGAEESPGDFVEAFDRINNLFVSEAKKYNPDKAFKSKNMALSLTMVHDMIEDIDMKELIVDSNDYHLTREEIERQVKKYKTGDAQGIGAILIADMLDKSNNSATYQAVVFDIRTKEVISVREVSGKAKGFGLRNFWARSVLESMDRLAKSKK